MRLFRVIPTQRRLDPPNRCLMSKTRSSEALKTSRPTPPSLVKNRDFVYLWWIGLTSFLVRWLEILVFGVFTYQHTGSAFMVAMMTMLRLLPMALFGVFFGALAERIVRRQALILVISLSLLTALSLTVIAFTGHLEVWHLAVASFINGTAWATDNPVRRTMIGDVIGNERMASAMSIEVGTSNATRLAGPSMGGLILATAGIEGAFALTSVMYLLALAAAIAGRNRNRPALTGGTSLLNSLATGFKVLKSDPRLTGAMWITVLFNLFGWPVLSMVPVIGQDRLGLTPEAIGLLASSDGLGALISALIIARLSRPGRYGRIYLAGVVTFLAALPVFALATHPLVAAGALFFAGVGQGGFAIMQATITFFVAPPGRRSQAMGLMTACIGVGPIGFLVLGALAEVWGATTTAVLMSMSGLLITAMSWRLWRATWSA